MIDDIPPLESSISAFNHIINEMYAEYIFAETFAREETLGTLLKLLRLKAERIRRTLAPREKIRNGLKDSANSGICLQRSFLKPGMPAPMQK